ncbi:DUF2996 domain-containing protein [Prochlorococcus marinus]|uniref:DUF2996 domain-containing protein n=1 Tax=Prochlorococcus marinus TaxID=1219 RepID=UPI0022B58009|nr:DUF2996 domain-containing protein [Prochlorococcus marinus]
MEESKGNELINNNVPQGKDINISPDEKKIKPPKLEDKPFEDFIKDDFIPGLQSSLKKHGLDNSTIVLKEGERPVTGGTCWQVEASLPQGRKFWVCFSSNKLSAQKYFSLAESGNQPSLLESFLIDERKITLPLLISRTLQRLNGQKWLGKN